MTLDNMLDCVLKATEKSEGEEELRQVITIPLHGSHPFLKEINVPVYSGCLPQLLKLFHGLVYSTVGKMI
jgi:hypothetical protein